MDLTFKQIQYDTVCISKNILKSFLFIEILNSEIICDILSINVVLYFVFLNWRSFVKNEKILTVKKIWFQYMRFFQKTHYVF